MRLSRTTWMILAVGMTLPSIMFGALIQADWKTPGDNRAFYDTTTDLKWLDARHTRGSSGYSYNEMTTKLGPGGEFEGWRYASFTEFEELLTHAGLPFHAGASLRDAPKSAYNDGLYFSELAGGPILFAGHIDGDPPKKQAYAINWIIGPKEDPNGKHHVVNTFYTGYESAGYVFYPAYDDDDYAWSHGHALVYDHAVPEPTSLALWAGLGIMGLIGAAKRKRKRVV